MIQLKKALEFGLNIWVLQRAPKEEGSNRGRAKRINLNIIYFNNGLTFLTRGS